jgi:beta-glucuronidase
VQGARFLLNGKPVYFHGASRHEDFPVIGRGVNDAVLVKDFSMMKWMGANSFRTVHYPYAEEVLNMADRLGFMVIDETPAVGMNGKGRPIFKKGLLDDRTRKTHLALLERQYHRDKNHPSIVMWSLSNEPSSSQKGFLPYIKPVFDRIRELDPTRPATVVVDTNAKIDKAAHLYDVICINPYWGWYDRVGQLGAIDEDLSRQLDEWYARYKKPVMLTEFGCDTVAGMHSHKPLIFTEEYQLELVKRHAKVLDSKPFVIGEHVWVMCDFLTKQGITRVGGNRKGLFTRLREPKMAVHWLRERWGKM